MQRFIVSTQRDGECHLVIQDEAGVLLTLHLSSDEFSDLLRVTLHLSSDEFSDLLRVLQDARSRRTNVTA